MADEVQILTEEDVAKLPRRAQVALAIRCARRVQPLFRAAWPDAPDEHVEAIEQALQCAERLLSGDESVLPAATAAAARVFDIARDPRVAEAAIYAAKAAAEAVHAIADASATTMHAIRAAAYAAQAAGDEVEDSTWHHHAIEKVIDIRRQISEGYYDFGERLDSIVDALLKDLATDEGKPTRPKRDLDDANAEETLVISAHVDESVHDDTLVESIIELYRALNKYHIACGGSGLMVDDWQIRVRAGVPEGEAV